MGLHADRAHARATATMGNAEGLVQVHVAHVGAQFGRAHQADLGIEVCTIEINLPAMVMNDLADIDDRLFEHAVGGGIGDHECGQLGCMLLWPWLQDRSHRRCRCASQATATICMPAMAAEAGLVPWAETGMRQMSRSWSPRDS